MSTRCISISCSRIFILSFVKSILVFAFFMASLLKSRGNSLLITSVYIVISLLLICTGIMTDFKEPTVSPSPNLNLVSLRFSTTFSVSSGKVYLTKITHIMSLYIRYLILHDSGFRLQIYLYNNYVLHH